MHNKLIFTNKKDMPFILGTFNKIIHLLNKKLINIKKTEIVLPCSLNDLAQIDRNPKLKIEYQKVDVFLNDSMFITLWFRFKYKPKQIERAYGPAVLKKLLEKIRNTQISKTFICANEATMFAIKNRYNCPNHKTSFFILPREANSDEEELLIKQVSRTQSNLIVIGIGSPKQVELATKLKRSTKASLIFCGGAALEFIAGTKKQAPIIIQRNGLEWLFRLINEPKRLFSRYLIHIPLFLIKSVKKSLKKNSQFLN